MPHTYTENFGDEWNAFRRTQLDSVTGLTITRDRFFRGTKWPSDLRGEHLLEVGCGAGRFTEILLGTGATVVSVDDSAAVEACQRNHGPHPRLTVVRANLFALPFPTRSFDRLFCYGVLQHTPDPEAAFRQLVRYVKAGGYLAVDVYDRQPPLSRFWSKYLWRPITTQMPPRLLRRLIEFYVPLWLPVDDFFSRIPKLRRLVPGVVPCWNYRGLFPLTEQQRREWAILDTYDALGARYDFPQTIESVRTWFANAGLVEVDVHPGGNGIEGNARVSHRPAPSRSNEPTWGALPATN